MVIHVVQIAVHIVKVLRDQMVKYFVGIAIIKSGESIQKANVPLLIY